MRNCEISARYLGVPPEELVKVARRGGASGGRKKDPASVILPHLFICPCSGFLKFFLFGSRV